MNWKVPSGSTPLSTIVFAARYATSAVGVPGFSITGTPASSAHAIFSHMPHAGKLNALTCTAAPRRGTSTCWPQKRGVRPSWMPSPSASEAAPSGSVFANPA